ncbi:hypothetical protein ACM66B_003522 [Microbotryomycetes sp. NB124-2]
MSSHSPHNATPVEVKFTDPTPSIDEQGIKLTLEDARNEDMVKLEQGLKAASDWQLQFSTWATRRVMKMAQAQEKDMNDALKLTKELEQQEEKLKQDIRRFLDKVALAQQALLSSE